MIIEPVSRSAEELALLRGIADHPSQDLPRLMYADWLEEQGDPRGPFFREFVQAFRAGEPLPDADVPAAWADLVGVAILKAAADAEMREFADQFLSHARPAIRLDVSDVSFDDPPEPPEALGTTRLGGDPDLPAGSEFPTDSRGGPLHLLGQFDLEEIHGFVGGRAFPADGLLSIFRTQAEGKNCYPGPADWPRFVRRIPKGTTLERSARPEGNGEPPAPYRPDLVLRDSLRLPASPDKWAGLTIDYKQMWRFDGLLPATLRGEAFILLGHAVHGNTGDEPLLERPDWLQLLLVPFVEGPDFGISDMSLSLHLPAADLKLGRFDRLETSFG